MSTTKPSNAARPSPGPSAVPGRLADPWQGPAQPSTDTMILLITATVAALYLGRDVFIPLALAILFSFALGPLVTRLHRLGIGRVPAVLTVIAMVVMLLVGFGALVASQLAHLADGLPTYEANLRAKAQALASAAPGGNIVDRAADLLRNIGEDIEQVTEGQIASGSAETATAASQPRPIPVEIHEPPPPPIQALSGLLGPLLAPIATAGVAVVFVIFVLLQREDLRDRLIRLFGATDVHRSTEAITDAAKRIGRYLLMQLVINVAYGVPVGIGLWLIGVPNALLWGILATVLRFIPYLGPVLAATLPIALSLAVDPGWTTPLLTVSLFVTLELFSNNVMEPWLYGASTGLSPLAIIVAAVFWTTLWGPVGLLLSTPLTVCLVVLGRHVPQLNFIEVLLGDAPVLTPEVKFYQRLLADDPIDAEELAQEQLEEQPLAEVYEATLMPALAMAEQDRGRGALERSRAQAMSEAAQGIVDRLAEDTDDAKEKPAVAPSAVAGNVLCLGGRTGFDACFAAMLAHLLHGRGMAARPGSLSAGLPTADELATADLVCLCYVDPGATRHARRLIQRLRARRESSPVPVVLCMWQLPAEAAERALAVAGADRMARSLRGAMDVVLELTGPAEQRPPAATPEPAATPTALGAVST